jgi:hypothetical protein
VERESSEERPADRIEPEDAKPAEDGPTDRDVRPRQDTDRVVEEKGEGEPDG